MALNAEDTVAMLRFEQTMKVGKDIPVDHMLGHAANMARGTKRKKMHTLAISCHGAYLYAADGGHTEDSYNDQGGFGLLIGSRGIGIKNCRAFEAVRNCFEQIVIVACGAAAVASGGVVQDLIKHGNGLEFCWLVARSAQCAVIASEEFQVFEPGVMDFGTLEIQGKCWRFESDHTRTLIQGVPETLGS
jgi:hypothetical protein